MNLSANYFPLGTEPSLKVDLNTSLHIPHWSEGILLMSQIAKPRAPLASVPIVPCVSTGPSPSSLLMRQIPDFDLANTVKRDINVKACLTFNGLEKRVGEPVKPSSSRRSKDVMVRVVNALSYPVAVSRFALPDRQDDAVVCLIDIVRRAAFYQQALRVSVTNGLKPCCAGVWWLYASQDTPVLDQPHDHQPSLSLTLRRTLANSDLAYEQIRTPTIERTVSRGYAGGGTLYALTLQCHDGTLLQLDYDALLVDQTHVGVDPLAYQEGRHAGAAKAKVRKPINWMGWLSGEDRPAKLMGPLTTANVNFESNLNNLRWWFEHESPVVNGRHTRQLDWSTCGFHYKFVEHMVLKAQQGNIQISHAERLIGLDFTWGIDHQPARDVLASTPYYRKRRRSPLPSAQMTWTDKLAHRINLKAIKANATGKVVMVVVQGEKDTLHRFQSATSRYRTLEIKYYSGRSKAGRLSSTVLDLSRVRGISFGETELWGVDYDGKRVCIDFSVPK